MAAVDLPGDDGVISTSIFVLVIVLETIEPLIGEALEGNIVATLAQ